MSLFKQIKGLKPRKHYFNLSYDNKFTCDIGQLIPVLCEEVLPSDHIKIGNEAVVRLQPMVAPMLQSLDLRIELFFVPTRLLDVNWEDFITGGKDGKDDYVLPLHDEFYIADKTPTKYSLWDYFGLPLVKSNSTTDPDKDSLPIDYPWRAYNLIYNEYYRDENVMDEVDLSQGDVLCRCWSKDYFTSALPFQQRGDAPAFSWSFDNIFDNAKVSWDHDIPVAWSDYASFVAQGSPDRTFTSFPFNTIGLSPTFAGLMPVAAKYNGYFGAAERSRGTNVYPLGNISDNTVIWSGLSDPDSFDIDITSGTTTSSFNKFAVVPKDGKEMLWFPDNDTVRSKKFDGLNDAKLTMSGDPLNISFSITELRENFQLQKYLERNARGGYRYVEQLYARFGVRNGDLRLQRPHFLGSARQSIMVSEIPQTSATGATGTPQANLAGKGLGAMVSKSLCNYHVKEHGYIIGLFSIMPKTSYCAQGINKKWLRRTKFDYYTPEFAHLSESQILNRELYYTGDASGDLQSFGYQGIYDEYRHNRGIITSDFRDTFAYWHMGRKFSNAPALNSDFLVVDPNATYLKAPFAVQNERNFLVDYVNVIHAMRPMPSIAEPGLVDHF